MLLMMMMMRALLVVLVTVLVHGAAAVVLLVLVRVLGESSGSAAGAGELQQQCWVKAVAVLLVLQDTSAGSVMSFLNECTPPEALQI